MRFHSIHTRDSSLRRLGVLNRWLIAGSLTITGVLTDVAAHAFPSKSPARSTAKPAGGRASHHSKRSSGSSTTATEALHPPAQAPQAHESAPAEEPAAEPAPQSAPAPESTPVPQAAPEREAAPEPPPSHESAPAEEPSAPVVSGGS